MKIIKMEKMAAMVYCVRQLTHWNITNGCFVKENMRALKPP
jgi:hypothetical protein